MNRTFDDAVKESMDHMQVTFDKAVIRHKDAIAKVEQMSDADRILAENAWLDEIMRMSPAERRQQEQNMIMWINDMPAWMFEE